MSQFKVGDRVRRINCDNGDWAKIGQEATVIQVYELSPSLQVVYPGHHVSPDEPGELWYCHNTQKIEEEKKVDYQFKVGDTGKTRNGSNYRVICTDRKGSHDFRVVALVFGSDSVNEEVRVVRSDGTFFDNDNGRKHPFDLLPPTLTRYVALYPDGYYVSAGTYGTRGEAEESTSLTGRKPIKIVKVEVPCDE